MKKLVTLCIIILPVILLTAAGCQQGPATFTSALELTTQKTTLEEASSIIGRTVPVPTYLPKDYKIQEVYIALYPEKLTRSTVTLLISDEGIEEKKLITYTIRIGSRRTETRQRYEFQCKMKMTITWYEEGIPGGLKLPGEGVTIGETRGKILDDRSDHNTLWWQPRPGPGQEGMFDIHLSASKSIPKGELVKVAKSVQYSK